MAKVNPNDITLDPAFHAREGVDHNLMLRYAKRMESGDEFPPVQLYTDGKSLWPVDGWHRILANKLLKRDSIQAVVRKGTAVEALRDAPRYNQGQGMSRADKQASVVKMLAQSGLAELSDRELARICGVSHPFVKKVRGSVGNVSNTPRVGADGRRYKPQKPPSVGNVSNTEIEVEENQPLSPPVGNVSNTPFDGDTESLEITGPPIDTSDVVFEERVEHELLPGRGIEVVARSGLPKPLNWTGSTPVATWRTDEVLTPGLLARVAEVVGHSREEWVKPLLEKLRKHPDPVVREGAGYGLENHEDPLQAKRDALPAVWVELLYEMMELGAKEAFVTRFLRTFLDKKVRPGLN